MNQDNPLADTPATKEPRLWQDNGWTARVIKNEDDEGWAVEMIKDGEPEPALGPVNTQDARCVVRQKALSKAQNEAGVGPGEALQRRARPFGEQPFGNVVMGVQRGVARLAKANSLGSAVRLALRPHNRVRTGILSVNRP
jgi:hypothetical protein